MSTPGFDTSATEAELAEMRRRDQVRLALPPGRYPCLVQAAGPMTACGADYQEFHDRFGIDLFIAGVEAKAVVAKATGSPPI
jgi:TetR/AcrR family tetracycline transcriptional repressor